MILCEKDNLRELYMCVSKFHITGGPRYMQEKGTNKLGSHIMNSHIKRPRIPKN